MRILMRNALVVGLQLAAVAGCGSSQAPASSAVQSSQPASQAAGVGATVAQNSDGVWTLREEVDPLTDTRKTIGTIAFRSQEQGRYQFDLVVADLSADPRATVRVSIFDGEPTGLRFETLGGNRVWTLNSGRSRIDDNAPTTFNWVQSDEFANVFSATIPLKDLLSTKRRLLLSGLRSDDEVFELPRDRRLWDAIQARLDEHARFVAQHGEPPSLMDTLEKFHKTMRAEEDARDGTATQRDRDAVRVSEDGKQVQTPAGALSVVCPKEAGIGCAEPIRVRWQEQDLYTSGEAQSIDVLKQTHRLTDGLALVLAEFSGGSACPAQYLVVLIESSGKATITPTFGSCSDEPRISAESNALVFTFPTANGSETYRFADRKITGSRQ